MDEQPLYLMHNGSQHLDFCPSSSLALSLSHLMLLHPSRYCCHWLATAGMHCSFCVSHPLSGMLLLWRRFTWLCNMWGFLNMPRKATRLLWTRYPTLVLSFRHDSCKFDDRCLPCQEYFWWDFRIYSLSYFCFLSQILYHMENWESFVFNKIKFKYFRSEAYMPIIQFKDENCLKRMLHYIICFSGNWIAMHLSFTLNPVYAFLSELECWERRSWHSSAWMGPTQIWAACWSSIEKTRELNIGRLQQIGSEWVYTPPGWIGSLQQSWSPMQFKQLQELVNS